MRPFLWIYHQTDGLHLVRLSPVAVEEQMCTRFIGVDEVWSQDSQPVPLIEHNELSGPGEFHPQPATGGRFVLVACQTSLSRMLVVFPCRIL